MFGSYLKAASAILKSNFGLPRPNSLDSLRIPDMYNSKVPDDTAYHGAYSAAFLSTKLDTF
jgi:hypothetical protein